MTTNPTILALRQLRSHPVFITESWNESIDEFTTVVRRTPSIGAKVKDRCGTTYLMRTDGSLYRLNTKSPKKCGHRSRRREIRRQFFLSTQRP